MGHRDAASKKLMWSFSESGDPSATPHPAHQHQSAQQDEFCRRTLYSARVSRRHQPNVSFYTERSSDFFSPVALILLSQQVCTVFLPQRKFLRPLRRWSV